MVGNIIMLLVIAACWYWAFSKLDRGSDQRTLRMAVLIFLALAFTAVFLATLGFCPGTPGNQPRTLL